MIKLFIRYFSELSVVVLVLALIYFILSFFSVSNIWTYSICFLFFVSWFIGTIVEISNAKASGMSVYEYREHQEEEKLNQAKEAGFETYKEYLIHKKEEEKTKKAKERAKRNAKIEAEKKAKREARAAERAEREKEKAKKKSEKKRKKEELKKERERIQTRARSRWISALRQQGVSQSDINTVIRSYGHGPHGVLGPNNNRNPSEEGLMKLPGIGPVTAKKIMTVNRLGWMNKD